MTVPAGVCTSTRSASSARDTVSDSRSRTRSSTNGVVAVSTYARTCDCASVNERDSSPCVWPAGTPKNTTACAR